MRQTAKYVQACKTARAIGLIADSLPHDELYQALDAAGYQWSAKHGEWEYRPVPQIAPGEGSNVYRARLMAHPNQIDSFVTDATKVFRASGYVIDEISDPYPNRRGVGSRVYLTMTKAGD